MAKHTYRVASTEGASFAQRDAGPDAPAVSEGDTVELDLDVNTKRAVVAAGWLEPVDDVTVDDELESLTIAELDDRFGTLDGYPRSGTKADKITFVTEGGHA